jgi:uncharacterized protein YuzE
VRIRATYDSKADAIGAYFAPEGVECDAREEVAPGLTLDFDTAGRVIGLEILGVRRFLAEGRIAPAALAGPRK